MIDLIAETLELVDRIYPPTDKAVRLRNMLRESSRAPETELSFYVAQLSLLITLTDNLSASRSPDEMVAQVFEARVAIALILGLLRHGFNTPTEEVTN